jgi:L-threonylcarbamoyladenylate synthase
MSRPATDPATLQQAVATLRNGGLVAYPTDTVYGLAALPTDDAAIDRLFAAKGRDVEKAVPLLIASPADLALVAGDVPEAVRLLMHAFWPGALTIVLPRAAGFRSKALDGTVAVRVPDHPVPRELVRLLGAPITGTSANVSGGPDPLAADDVRAQLGEAVDLIIDGGPCPGGRPSTVVDCTVDPPRVVRQGPVSREELVRATGFRFE